MNSNRSYTLVIILALLGGVAIAAVTLVSLTGPAAEPESIPMVVELTAETSQEASSANNANQPLPTAVAGLPNGSPSALQPHGSVAEAILTQWWVMLILATIIFIYVMGVLLLAIYSTEPNITAENDSVAKQRNFIAINGVAMPVLALTVVFALTLGTLSKHAQQETELTIEVIGHQWWWEVRYPDHEVVTANEIYIPVGHAVRFNLSSADVIHSFWVPELGGKMDLIPGRINNFWLQADDAGEYRGQCAEYCGVQHARMAFLVIAVTPEEFQSWIEQQRQPARPPEDELAAQGLEIFMTSECIACHTIRGTDAMGVQGPDLTHLASRRTIAAGMLPNTTGYLAGWVIDSQGIKPGSLMPAMDISGQDLQALLAYLTSLD